MNTEMRAYDIVVEAISRQFNHPVDYINEKTVALDVPGWDSFSNGMLIMRLEEMCGKQLPFDEVYSAGNVGEMAAVVSRHL